MEELIQTIEGALPVSKLARRDLRTENEREIIEATEWYYQDKLVRRDAHVTLLNKGLSDGE